MEDHRRQALALNPTPDNQFIGGHPPAFDIVRRKSADAGRAGWSRVSDSTENA
jgi:hypothetical protein